jgi:hypothetical protein
MEKPAAEKAYEKDTQKHKDPRHAEFPEKKPNFDNLGILNHENTEDDNK